MRLIRRPLLDTLVELAYQYREEPFKLSSGQVSNHYVNCRPVLLMPLHRRWAGKLIARMMDLHGLARTPLAGVVLGGVPLADAVSSILHLDTVYVRPEPKAHGVNAGKRVEWAGRGSKDVVLLEDVVTTGSSSLRASAALEEEGFTVKAVIALVDREEGGRYTLSKYPFFSIYTLAEIAEIAERRQEIFPRATL